MSFLKKLFGGGLSGGSDEAAEAPAGKAKRQIEQDGFIIKATPYKDQGQWQTCGVVSKTIDGVVKEHRFVRADRFGDEESAADHAIIKGRQLIEQLGDRMFQP